MTPDKDIKDFSSISDENENISKSSIDASKMSCTSSSKCSSLMNSNSNDVSFSPQIATNNSTTQTSRNITDSRSDGENNRTLRFENDYGETFRRNLMPVDSQNSTPQNFSQQLDNFNILSQDAAEKTYGSQEATITDAPLKFQYPFSGAESIFDSELSSTFPTLNKNTEDSKDFSPWTNSKLFEEIPIDEGFKKEFFRTYNGDSYLPAERFILSDEDFLMQRVIEESSRASNLEFRANFQGSSVYKSPTFKKSETPLRKREKVIDVKTLTKSRNKLRKIKSFEGSKVKEVKKEDLPFSQALKNLASRTNISSKNDSHSMFENVLDVNYFSDFQNLSAEISQPDDIVERSFSSQTDTGSRSQRDHRRVSRSRSGNIEISVSGNDNREVTASQNDSKKVSVFRNDHREVTASQNDSKKVSVSRNDNREVTASQNDSKKLSVSQSDNKVESRSDNRRISRFRNRTDKNDTHRSYTRKVPRARRNFAGNSPLETPSLANIRQEEYLNSIVFDASKLDDFISSRLEVLEKYIDICNCELNNIPPWTPKLAKVLHNLTKHRDIRVCEYLLVRYNSERRLPLSEIRGQFIDILVLGVKGMTEILEDLRVLLSEGDIRKNSSIIDNAKSFWGRLADDYKELIAEFYHIRADYTNFNYVCDSMDECFRNITEVFNTFHEDVIDLFERF